MISAFSHRIQDLTEQIQQQKDQLVNFKQHFEKKIEASQSACNCKPILDTIQCRVNDNAFKISHLTEKFNQLQFGGFNDGGEFGSPQTCSDMNEDSSPFVDANIGNSICFSPAWKAPGSREPTPSKIPEGYESPPFGSPVAECYSAKEFFAAASFANPGDYNGNIGVGVLHTKNPPSPSSPVKHLSNSINQANPWSFNNPKIKEPPLPLGGSPVPMKTDRQTSSAAEINMSLSSPIGNQTSFSVENITSIAAENSHLKQQIVTYRQKVVEIEDKIRVDEATIGDLRMVREHFVQKEREWNEKQDWYEHKLKLLKQDKRRRGETIGKLLKCLDDCKDSGRLDDTTRIKEGKAVLNATLNTRGMHPEERIVKVVEAVEFDRPPRVFHDGFERMSPPPDGSSNPHLPQDNGNANRNNSSFWAPHKGNSLDFPGNCLSQQGCSDNISNFSFWGPHKPQPQYHQGNSLVNQSQNCFLPITCEKQPRNQFDSQNVVTENSFGKNPFRSKNGLCGSWLSLENNPKFAADFGKQPRLENQRNVFQFGGGNDCQAESHCRNPLFGEEPKEFGNNSRLSEDALSVCEEMCELEILAQKHGFRPIQKDENDESSNDVEMV